MASQTAAPRRLARVSSTTEIGPLFCLALSVAATLAVLGVWYAAGFAYDHWMSDGAENLLRNWLGSNRPIIGG